MTLTHAYGASIRRPQDQEDVKEEKKINSKRENKMKEQQAQQQKHQRPDQHKKNCIIFIFEYKNDYCLFESYNIIIDIKSEQGKERWREKWIENDIDRLEITILIPKMNRIKN